MSTFRAIAETVVTLLLASAFTVAATGLLELVDGGGAATAFVDTAPRTVFGILWPAFLVCTVLLLISNLRNRHRTSPDKFATGVLSVLAACVVSSVGWMVFVGLTFGWGLFLVGIMLVPTVVFFISATLALRITHFGFFRRSATGT